MPIHTEIISSFLTKWETRQLRGYIPCDPKNYTGGPSEGFRPIGASGVTIATGLDLGQQDKSSLLRYGIVGELLDKLTPYLGKTTYRAIDALAERKLLISDEECDIINRGVHADYIRQAQTRYDRASVFNFADIPAAAQAVIVSLGYQLGSPSRYPDGVWGALLKKDWNAASVALRADDSRYYRRRRDEAKLLDTISKENV